MTLATAVASGTKHQRRGEVPSLEGAEWRSIWRSGWETHQPSPVSLGRQSDQEPERCRRGSGGAPEREGTGVVGEREAGRGRPAPPLHAHYLAFFFASAYCRRMTSNAFFWLWVSLGM